MSSDQPAAARTPMRYDIPIPLPGGKRHVWIAGLFPVTADEWDHVMNVLAAMRPGLTDSSEPDHGSVEDGFGSVWPKCERGVNCGLEVVRPGKVQCWCDDGSTEPPSDEDDQEVYDRVPDSLGSDPSQENAPSEAVTDAH